MYLLFLALEIGICSTTSWVAQVGSLERNVVDLGNLHSKRTVQIFVQTCFVLLKIRRVIEKLLFVYMK